MAATRQVIALAMLFLYLTVANPIPPADPFEIPGWGLNTTNSTALLGPGEPYDPFSVREDSDWTLFSAYREPLLQPNELDQFETQFNIFLNGLMLYHKLTEDDAIPENPVTFTSPNSLVSITLWNFAKFHRCTFANALNIGEDLARYGVQWRGKAAKSCDITYKEKIDDQWVQIATGEITKAPAQLTTKPATS